MLPKYFYGTTTEGGVFGRADQVDTSGRPLLGYRKPGDTSTTTDYTRVATTFDPRKAQPLTRDEYYNPRFEGLRAALKDELGIAYSDELDHAIALTLSGSNQRENLRPIPKEQNREYGVLESQLAREVASGKKSLFDAQIEVAKTKGINVPYTGKPDTSIWSKLNDSINKLSTDILSARPPKKAGEVSPFLREPTEIGPAKADTLTEPRKTFEEKIYEIPVLGKIAKVTDEAVNSAVQRILDFNEMQEDPESTHLERAAGTVSTLLSAGTAMIFTAPTAALQAAEDVPILGPVAKVVNELFIKAGEVGGGFLKTSVEEALAPIKDKLTDREYEATLQAADEIGALGGQIVLGKGLHVGGKEAGVELKPEFKKARKVIMDNLKKGYDLYQEIPGKQGGFVRIGPDESKHFDLADEKITYGKDGWKKNEVEETTNGKTTVVRTEEKVMNVNDLPQELKERYVEALENKEQARGTGVENATKAGVKFQEVVDEIATHLGLLKKEAPLKDSTISKELQSRTEEAKKFKSAEEYADAKLNEKYPTNTYSLSAKSPRLFHETNPETATMFARAYSDKRGLNVATDKDFALGQKGKGAVVEFDSTGMDGRPIKKPAAEFVGQKEFELLKGGENAENVVSITFKDASIEKSVRPALLEQLVRGGKFERIEQPNGEIKYARNFTPRSQLTDFYNKATAIKDKTAEAFDRSAGQESVGKIDDTDAVVGTFGRNAIERKTTKGQSDRIPLSELQDTVGNLTGEKYTAGDSSFRKDNVVRIAEMPNGEKRAVITRTNAAGQQEVINMFKIGRDYEKFVANLESFGIPAGSRTRISSLEERQSGPLTYEDRLNNTEVGENVKGAKTRRSEGVPATEAESADTPQALTKTIDKALDDIAASKDPQQIEQIMIDNFSMDPGEARRLSPYLADIKSPKIVRDTIEGFDRVKRNYKPEEYPEEIQNKTLELEMIKEALDMNPARELAKYVSRTTGELPEVLGGKKTVMGRTIGEFGRRGDDIVTELGFKTPEDANAAYLRYARNKILYNQELEHLSEAKKSYLKSLEATAYQKPLKPEEVFLPQSPWLPDAFKTDQVHLPKLAGEILQSQANRDYLISEATHRGQTKTLEQITKDYYPKINVKQKVGIHDFFRTPDRVLRKMGLGPEYDLLDNSYRNYQIELPAHLDVLKDWMKRATQKGANERIFDYLDGKAKESILSPVEKDIVGEIKTYLRDWADRLNIPMDERISHYITRLFDSEEIKMEFDPDLARIITDKVPGGVYDPFLVQRIGRMGYKRDAWLALEAYVKRAVRKANMDPALERLKGKADTLEKTQYDYVKNYLDDVNMRPTMAEEWANNSIKTFFGYRWGDRPALSMTNAARMMIYRGALGLNIKSAIRNLTQGINTYAKLGEKYTIIGYTKLLTGQFDRKEIAQIPAITGNIVEKRLSSKPTVMEKLDYGLFAAMKVAEYTNRVSAYLGAKAKAIAEGKSEYEAVKYAEKIVKDTQFSYTSIDTPRALRGPFMKTILQFGSYAIKQSEFMIELAKSKDIPGMIRFTLATGLTMYTLGKSLGIDWEDVVPLSYFTNLLGWGKGGRFGGPAVLQLPKAAFGEVSDALTKGSVDPLKSGKNMLNASLIFLPGGIQGKRIYDGLNTYYTDDFKESIERTPLNMGKAMILGKQSITNKGEEIRGIYDKAKKLEAQGKGDEAGKLIDKLSYDEYLLYKKIRASEKAKQTILNKINQSKADKESVLPTLPPRKTDTIKK